MMNVGHRVIKFIIVMAMYFCLIYLFVSWLAGDIDCRYWWDWQVAVMVTAMVCFGACMADRVRSDQ